jgi:hypothetical protein
MKIASEIRKAEGSCEEKIYKAAAAAAVPDAFCGVNFTGVGSFFTGRACSAVAAARASMSTPSGSSRSPTSLRASRSAFDTDSRCTLAAPAASDPSRPKSKSSVAAASSPSSRSKRLGLERDPESPWTRALRCPAAARPLSKSCVVRERHAALHTDDACCALASSHWRGGGRRLQPQSQRSLAR